jgi:hypothetical protein
MAKGVSGMATEHWYLEVDKHLGARAMVILLDQGRRTCWRSSWRLLASDHAAYTLGKLQLLRRIRESKDGRGEACPHVKYPRQDIAQSVRLESTVSQSSQSAIPGIHG